MRRPLAVCLAAALTLGGASVPAGVPSTLQGSGSATRPLVPTRGPAAKHSSTASHNAIGYVINCNDSGAGSLRDAVAAAVDHGSVNLGSVACSTITLTSGAIDVPVGSLYLYGIDADAVTIDGNGSDRVFNHTGSGNLVVSSVSLRNGHAQDRGGCIRSSGNVFLYSANVSGCTATGTDAFGGGVYAAKDFRMHDSRITGNSAVASSGYSYGGGVYAHHDANVMDSKIAGNSAATGQGGGVFALGRGLVARSTVSGNSALSGGGLSLGTGSTPHSITQSTISGNTATRIGGINAHSAIGVYGSTIAFNTETDAFGAGLRVLGATVLQSTIIARNLSGGIGGDVGGSAGATLSGANNLIGTSTLAVPADTLSGDPLLAPLADDGGPTQSHALQAGSPAIDHGNQVNNFFNDQRNSGFARVVGAAADIGAYEVQSTGITTIVGNCADSGAGSLRETVAAAASGDTIDLRSLGCGTITLGSALHTTAGALSFVGSGAASLTLDAGGHGRVFEHYGYGTLAISGMTLSHGRAYNATNNAQGGCIVSYGAVAITSTTIAGCTAESPIGAIGGGIFARGPARILSSVISGNTATSATSNVYGGGLMSQGLEMRDSTLTGNAAHATGTTGYLYSRGGGALIGGRVMISGSTIAGNFATREGGLFLRGNAAIIDSTISGNTAVTDAAGIYAFGFLDLWNSTVTANSLVGDGISFGVGINAVHVAHLESSIVHGNFSHDTAYDIGFGSNIAIIGTHNLIGFSLQTLPADTSNADPLLGPLQDNGGPTFTHALLAGSPAIDAGINPLALAFDQRGAGFPRTIGTATDIGACELTPISDTIFADGFD